MPYAIAHNPNVMSAVAAICTLGDDARLPVRSMPEARVQGTLGDDARLPVRSMPEARVQASANIMHAPAMHTDITTSTGRCQRS